MVYLDHIRLQLLLVTPLHRAIPPSCPGSVSSSLRCPYASGSEVFYCNKIDLPGATPLKKSVLSPSKAINCLTPSPLSVACIGGSAG